jgi:hypothetical protein
MLKVIFGNIVSFRTAESLSEREGEGEGEKEKQGKKKKEKANNWRKYLQATLSTHNI